MSRPKNRIPRLLKKIRRYWEHNPDLRLGQLITSIGREGKQAAVIYLEDDDLEILMDMELEKIDKKAARASKRKQA